MLNLGLGSTDPSLLGDAGTLIELSTEACLTIQPLEVLKLALSFDALPFVLGAALQRVVLVIAVSVDGRVVGNVGLHPLTLHTHCSLDESRRGDYEGGVVDLIRMLGETLRPVLVTAARSGTA
jgi:hypothetical protein